MRKLFCLVLLGLLLGKANGQVKPSSKGESAAIAAKCKAKPIYQPKLQLPEDWLGKDEKYVHEPVIAFTIREDGTVRDVKLIHRTGAKKLDAYIVRYVRQWKFRQMPRCPGVETTTSITIDFN
jgi:TonB family protein